VVNIASMKILVALASASNIVVFDHPRISPLGLFFSCAGLAMNGLLYALL